MLKNSKLVAMTLLTSLLLLAAINFATINVKAQGEATVIFLDAVGGTTDPSGTNTYAGGTAVTMTATPADNNFIFSNWIISGDTQTTTLTENPATITVSAGVTYAVQAVFDPILPIPGRPLPTDVSKAAIIVVLAGSGGTTSPPPGTYALADATQTTLTATPAAGWQFSHWSISGFPIAGAHGDFPFTPNPTENPYTIDHGYGNTYAYQPVFTPTGVTVPTPTGGATPTPTGVVGGLTMETWIIIGLVVVIVVILIAFGVFASRRKK